MTARTYQVNEIFYALQGEGVQAGTPYVFVRLSGCNLTCARDGEAGFDCDTECVSGRGLTAAEIATEARRLAPAGRWVCLTGGEPTLQADDALVAALVAAEFLVAIETNGTHPLPAGLAWVCVSPKSAEHTLRVPRADEVKYVRHEGQGIPRPTITATHYLVSPAFAADGTLPRATLAWCRDLCLAHPPWRLSVQLHKLVYRCR